MKMSYCLSVCLFAFAASTASATTVSYEVTIDTAPLIGHPAGPFSLDFQFTDGSGLGNANNTVTLSDFGFGGGSLIGTNMLTGGASGGMESILTLTDSSFFNEAQHRFIPGSSLTFRLTETGNVELGGTPDEFSATILDSSGAGLPSSAPNGGLLLSDINSPFPSVLSFSTSSTEAPVAGGPPISIAAPTVTSAVSQVPEPPSFWLIAITLITLVPVSFLSKSPSLDGYFIRR
jgi:hypothetical protein